MIQPIVKDKQRLKEVSVPATEEDRYVIAHLIDTINTMEECIGMAANMIGINKTMMVIKYFDTPKMDHYVLKIIINPEILKEDKLYETEENCMCFVGELPIKTKRYDTIKIAYLNERFEKRIQTFKGINAQCIQHQMDHFKGVII